MHDVSNDNDTFRLEQRYYLKKYYEFQVHKLNRDNSGNTGASVINFITYDKGVVNKHIFSSI
jgi:hypothetical protein